MEIKNIFLGSGIEVSIIEAFRYIINTLSSYFDLNVGGYIHKEFITNSTTSVIISEDEDFRNRKISISGYYKQDATPVNFLIGGSSDSSIRASAEIGTTGYNHFNTFFYSGDSSSYYGELSVQAGYQIRVWADPDTGALKCTKTLAFGNEFIFHSKIDFSNQL